jgi:hypothetical protein
MKAWNFIDRSERLSVSAPTGKKIGKKQIAPQVLTLGPANRRGYGKMAGLLGLVGLILMTTKCGAIGSALLPAKKKEDSPVRLESFVVYFSLGVHRG